MFAELYFKTTNPNTTYTELLLNPNVYVSILSHVLLYCSIYYMTSKCVFKKNISKEKLKSLSCFLLIVMFLGYIGRLCRAKQLYNVYHNKEKVEQMMNTGYFCWYFMG